MPDEAQVVRGIDWRSTLPFTLIFRSFRVAIHPSKLVLALIALLLIYFGGRVMDIIWVNDYLAVPNEVGLYVQTRGVPNSAQEFNALRSSARQEIVRRYDEESRLADANQLSIKDKILKDRDQAVEAARNSYDTSRATTEEDRRRVQQEQNRAIAAAYAAATARYGVVDAYKGIGLFRTFILNEIGMTHNLLRSGASGSWLGSNGALDQLINILVIAPGWAIRHHPLYFIVFGIYFLVVWAVFGGAIARIAAVQVARDEKISFRQALSFSTAKFLSFVSAPIIPLAIILGLGFCIFLGAWILFNIPYIGPIIGGALFFLAVGAAFIMTLVLLGLLGGINLMYPTIAVEGSDSFDAISRSFSYLFARPWRLLFYTLVGLIYGTFCFAFVRYFIKLMLAMAHGFAGMGVFAHADNTLPLWPVMWPDPLTAPQLSYDLDYLTLNWGQDIGATFLAFWVYMTLSVLGAFAISFYFSANTIIYILMRHEVDATELDDVYLEQTDEEFSEATVTTSGSVPADVPTTPSVESGNPIPPQGEPPAA